MPFNPGWLSHLGFSRAISNSTTAWPYEDFMAHITACVALETPHKRAVISAVSRRAGDLSAARSKATMEKYNEDFQRPCKWVRKLIDPSVPWSEQTRRWGFVAFKDAALDGNNDAWENFLNLLDDHVYSGLVWMKGGSAIIPTKQLLIADGFVDESNPEALRRCVHFLVPGISPADKETGLSSREWQRVLTRTRVS
jgi:hypothetical protein